MCFVLFVFCGFLGVFLGGVVVFCCCFLYLFVVVNFVCFCLCFFFLLEVWDVSKVLFVAVL